MNRLLLIFAVMASELLTAQTVINTGSLRGLIIDPTGAAIPAAQVELLEDATGTTSRQLTKREGTFVFLVLAVGQYSITVNAPGFKTAKIRGVTVQLGQTSAADIRLQPGATGESVQVTATTDMGGRFQWVPRAGEHRSKFKHAHLFAL